MKSLFSQKSENRLFCGLLYDGGAVAMHHPVFALCASRVCRLQYYAHPLNLTASEVRLMPTV